MERSKEVNKHREVHRVKTEHLVRISSDHRSVVGSMNLTFYPIRKSLSFGKISPLSTRSLPLFPTG